ncbi:MAG: phosphohydrolase [Clostridia bacterium]|jgi:hypothetical protein|nr:phosphohydrolase [Clostridia bacterium]
MEDYITTYKKIHFQILDPNPNDIDITDIAHSLSMMCRANGHFPSFYSVGQHCIDCANEAVARGLERRIALLCLLHDASEAYLSDITRPVKKYLDNYIKIEKNIQDSIYIKFAGSVPNTDEMKQIGKIDDTLLYYEFYYLMGEKLTDTKPKLISNPNFKTEDFALTEKKYIDIFNWLLK